MTQPQSEEDDCSWSFLRSGLVFIDGLLLSSWYGDRFGLAVLIPASRRTGPHIRSHYLGLSKNAAGEWQIAADDDPNPVVFKFARTQVSYSGPWSRHSRRYERHTACYDGQLGNTANVLNILTATI